MKFAIVDTVTKQHCVTSSSYWIIKQLMKMFDNTKYIIKKIN